MSSTAAAILPSMAPFPEASWRSHLTAEEWSACLDAWITVTKAHLSLQLSDFVKHTSVDESVSNFLCSYTGQVAMAPDLAVAVESAKAKHLRRTCFFLVSRLFDTSPPSSLLTWEFLSDFSKAYGKNYASKIISSAWPEHHVKIETSLAFVKTALTRQLEMGLKGDPSALELQLKRINQLLHVSPEADAFFMTGTDFLDGLVSCYKLMNPPLRKAIVTTSYLCVLGLTEGSQPNFSLLVDQLYSLDAAAKAHKAGPLNSRESLVVELVSSTPLLRQLEDRLSSSSATSSRAKSVLASLGSFRGPSSGRPKHLIKRKINKGKNVANNDYGHGAGEAHVHRMSLISQIQDLFPDLGQGFIMKLLDEYNEVVETVITHLLEGSLPTHLESADRTEEITKSKHNTSEPIPDLAPRSTPPLLPTRRNVFDDDEFDRLAISSKRLHLGRRNPGKTADAILSDRSNAPGAAAILSALAAFDADDDERDDTYDVSDVGGTVDSATPGGNPTEEAQNSSSAPADTAADQALFRAWKSNPALFERSRTTQPNAAREALRQETGLSDAAIEGWAVMLARDPRRLRRLETQFSSFAGVQDVVAGTAWRADSGTEDSDNAGRGGAGRGRGRGRGRGGGGAGRGRGNVAGPTGERETEVARRRKEANKGSSANHNRKAANARKMARGGFPG